MGDLRRELRRKIVGNLKHVNTVINIIAKNISADVAPYILKGLARIESIVLAPSFTKYGWYLAIYEVLGKIENGNIFVYYNPENPYWTSSIIVHELTHKALNIKRKTVLDTLIVKH